MNKDNRTYAYICISIVSWILILNKCLDFKKSTSNTKLNSVLFGKGISFFTCYLSLRKKGLKALIVHKQSITVSKLDRNISYCTKHLTNISFCVCWLSAQAKTYNLTLMVLGKLLNGVEHFQADRRMQSNSSFWFFMKNLGTSNKKCWPALY